MKLVIASDIHGAANYCKRLMAVIEDQQPDRVVLLGDLLYHGPRNDLPPDYAPKEVISMLNGIRQPITAVRGNCEAEVDQMVLEFPCMADYAIIASESGRELFCTHGHIFSPENLPSLAPGSAFLSGHTHIKTNAQSAADPSITLFNPGSVGIPKDGTHSCGLYDNGTFSHILL